MGAVLDEAQTHTLTGLSCNHHFRTVLSAHDSTAGLVRLRLVHRFVRKLRLGTSPPFAPCLTEMVRQRLRSKRQIVLILRLSIRAGRM